MTAKQAVLIGSLALALTGSANGQEIEDLKKGVVKITAQVEGKTKVGTGFIINLEKDQAYIVTAAHVIEGDEAPQIAFFPNANQFVKARVLGIEGGKENGVAALVVSKGVPKDARLLCVELETSVKEGKSVMVVGFPGTAGTPWMVSKGTLGGRHGSTFTLSGIIGEGNSGGPALVNDRVIGVVTEMRDQVGYAVPMFLAKFALEGWGVELPEAIACQKKEIVGKDGAPMVFVPAGEFLMGSDNTAEDEAPMHKVYLDGFYIDKHELTVAQYDRFVRETGYQEPDYWRYSRLEMAIDGARPIANVTWQDAVTYCRWAGKRLPTEAEWEKAARGTKGHVYPWGDTPPRDGMANFGKGWSDDWLHERLELTGKHTGDQGPYGILDMAGNVSEWVADWYSPDEYVYASSNRNPTGPRGGGRRVFRGGSWAGNADYMRSAKRHARPPDQALVDVGFRCAQEAK